MREKGNRQMGLAGWIFFFRDVDRRKEEKRFKGIKNKKTEQVTSKRVRRVLVYMFCPFQESQKLCDPSLEQYNYRSILETLYSLDSSLHFSIVHHQPYLRFSLPSKHSIGSASKIIPHC